jgi:hypothetical protein
MFSTEWGPSGSSQLTRGPCAAGGGCSGEMNVMVSPVQQRIRAGRCTTMTLGQRWGALAPARRGDGHVQHPGELVLGLGAEPGGLTTLDTGRRTCVYSVSRSIASAMAPMPMSFGCTPSPLSYSGRIRSGSVASANTRSRSTTAS